MPIDIEERSLEERTRRHAAPFFRSQRLNFDPTDLQSIDKNNLAVTASIGINGN
jgi:hypothetical protein